MPQPDGPTRLTNSPASAVNDTPMLALEDVSFTADAGEFVSLVGPSGCGKSTCLNLLAGLDESSSGAVEHHGRPVRGVNTQLGTCTVDGVVRQDGTTADLIFPIPYLIEYISRFTLLLPGDIIMTGTPEGVAPMEVGSTVAVEVEGIGVLENRLVAEPA